MIRALVASACVALAATCAPALAQSAPDGGKAFEPQPLSQPLYGTQPPVSTTVPAADGSSILVETHLPAPEDGRTPPERVPTILVMSPYENPQTKGAGAPMSFVTHFTRRGYAVAFGDVRGMGRSEGCSDLWGPEEIDATARTIEYVGRDAPWADGNVGMWGISYPAVTQVGAATFGDPERTRYLKAIIPIAPIAGAYDFVGFDGVPFEGWNDVGLRGYAAALTWPDGRATDPAQTLCLAQFLAEGRALDGDYTAWHAAREFRRGTGNVRAATLFFQGLLDYTGHNRSAVAFFDRLPASTPHKAVIGQWDHAPADGDNLLMTPVNRWPRADAMALYHAWFDRWLMHLPTGAESWPDVQVQGVDGQWREERGWPQTDGPVGRLALGPAGTLGATAPAGATAYPETSMQIGELRGTTFATPPLTGPLHLTGEPELELWTVLDRDDAHFAARLYALDAAGNRVTPEDTRLDGFRSAQHLDPYVEGRFEQGTARPAPVGTPLKIRIRFAPLDVTVPAGGRLVLGLSGGAYFNVYGPAGLSTAPSGSGANVQVLHDCAHPSVLRFHMPRENAKLLNVREKDEPADQPLATNPSGPLAVDGGGLARRRICGS